MSGDDHTERKLAPRLSALDLVNESIQLVLASGFLGVFYLANGT
jgi:hypothetical protein